MSGSLTPNWSLRLAGGDPQVAELLVQQDFELIDVLPPLKLGRDPGAIHLAQVGVGDPVGAQPASQLLGDALDGALQGLFGFHLQHQVHAALEVQAEVDFLFGPKGRLRCAAQAHVDGGQNEDHGGDDDDRHQCRFP